MNLQVTLVFRLPNGTLVHLAAVESFRFRSNSGKSRKIYSKKRKIDEVSGVKDEVRTAPAIPLGQQNKTGGSVSDTDAPSDSHEGKFGVEFMQIDSEKRAAVTFLEPSSCYAYQVFDEESDKVTFTVKGASFSMKTGYLYKARS